MDSLMFTILIIGSFLLIERLIIGIRTKFRYYTKEIEKNDNGENAFIVETWYDFPMGEHYRFTVHPDENRRRIKRIVEKRKKILD